MWKKIGIGVLILLVLIGGGVWYLFSDLDRLVKNAMQTYGTKAVQAPVAVDSVSLSLTTGQGAISGVTVGNPAGYYTRQAFGVGTISVTLDTGSVTGSGPIVIREVDIDRPAVTYEVGGGGSNLTTIQHNVQAYAASELGGGGSQSSAPQRKLIIIDLYVRQGEIGISATALHGKALNVPLPQIHLTNIGQANGGDTPAQIGAAVIGQICDTAAKAGAEALFAKVGQAAGAVVNGATGKFKSFTGL
jgi:hypothetical protein